ncbi:enoyl-CoA hydratase [Chryseobacterium sp.]|uniref:enoyl-CoA hydratase n=1 Tax=Chryseobacterium sp. TaxID=1871047 RepID=UPI0028A03820|nr:enoyl-CoA hydratase [Chryseobacterium sp.]
MLIAEEVFNLIKNKRRFLKDFENYKIKISNSNNFERDNLIGIYKIRQYSAERIGNNKLSREIGELILNLEDYQENKLRFVTLFGERYYGMYYLSANYDKVIGYLDNELDENGNIIS